MSPIPRRYSYVQPLLVVVFFLVVMSLPGGQRSRWSSLRPTASAASTFTVDSIGDGADSNPGDSTCNDGTGGCTLRAAIQETNLDTTGTDTINFNLPANSVITLNTGLELISGDVNINGPGANTLSITRSSAPGTPRFRIISIENQSQFITVNLSGLTLSNGRTSDGANGADGGGLWNGNEIVNLTGVVISGNSTGNGTPGSGGVGGGIFNFGTMTIVNSTISNNTTGSGGADPTGFGGYGAGIYNAGTLTLTSSTISGNTTGSGANGGYGAGIFNSTGCTLVNCTISGNQTASGGSGGGIRNYGTTNLKDTIVANNVVSGSGTGPDLSGPFVSQDYNLIENVTDASFTGITTHNLTGINPLLGPLAANGGTTPTLALLFGSPAIDAGNTNQSFDQRGQPRPIDNPNVANAAGGNAGDIGAYESHTLQVNSTADTTDGLCALTGVGNGCTLREAITVANGEAGAELINFAPSLTSGGPATITLLTSLPSLSSDMLIAGPGANLLTIERSSVGGTPDFRILQINAGKVIDISGLAISNGRAVGAFPGNRGSNIFSDHGIVTISSCTIKNAVGVEAIGNFSGTLVINDSLISGNSSGGVGNAVPQSNPSPNPASIVINRTTISGNGAVAVNNTVTVSTAISPATVTINQSAISGNSVDGVGGGAAVTNGVGSGGTAITTINNSTVSGNTNVSGTGAIYNAAVFSGPAPTIASIRINNSTIANNSGGGSAGSAGGISNLLSSCSGCEASIKLRNTIVAGNLNAGNPSDIPGNVDPASASNLIGLGGSGGLTNAVNNNQVGVANVGLGPLANNGGPTQTRALLPGSPAIDAASNCVLNNSCSPLIGSALTTDQRGVGFNRLVGTAVDIGAFESRGFTIAATGGSGQSVGIGLSFPAPLVATVSSAFGEPVLGGSVSFAAPVSGASGTFSGGSTTTTITLNSLGTATTPAFTANTVVGGYNVSATIPNTSTNTNFSLTNAKGATSTAVVSSVNPSDLGESITLTATVTASVSVPTGTVQFRQGPDVFGSPVTCVAGVGHTCTAQISSSSLGAGTRNFSAEYSGDASFLNSLLFSFTQTINPAPSLSINDVSLAEGDSGTKTASFTVTLSASSHLQVKVDYATANNSALSGSDYQSTSGTLTFEPGDTTKTVNVTVNGELNFEADETYFVNLATPVNATIADSQGLGTIVNDDPIGGYLKFPSANFVNDENAGQTTVSVNRIGDTSQAVTVDYATSDNGPLVPCKTINSFASSRCDYTTALGTLRFAAGETAKTFVVLISQDNYVEGSESLTITLSNPTGGAQFATPSTATLTITDDPFEPLGNPVDNADVFVRQHYHDFLNREPDAPGLAYWSNQITECFMQLTCSVEDRRVNVSAAFFLSIEFQETGYLVERIYKTAYGDADGTSVIGGTPHTIKVPIVRFNEFLRDSQQISKGVLVGVGNWQAQLEANKVAFTQDFVTRTRFTNAYPTTLTPAQFIDSLFLKISIAPSAAERTSIINEFGGAGTSADTAARARALRRVAESSSLEVQEKNKAFVLMQYFGYMRRNPDDPQDTDHTGYDFWLQKLNEHNGNYINAEMVKAFIVSGEYRNRFGQ
jgi:CSLREA domain-containing protein